MKTDCTFTQNDLGKNLYSKTTYYTVRIEQHVIAKDKDEADELFLEHGGINHSAVNNIAEDGNGVETTVCDETIRIQTQRLIWAKLLLMKTTSMLKKMEMWLLIPMLQKLKRRRK